MTVLYRTPGILAECLESIERHRPRRVREVIVIDNSVEPHDEPPAERFPWIRYIANDTNVHYRRANNQGARLASGRYLLFLNPDSRLTDSDSIALLAEILDEHPEIGLVGPKIQGDDGRVAPQGERRAGLPYLVAEKSYLNTLWPGNPIRRRQRGIDREGNVLPRNTSGPVDTLTAAVLMVRRGEFTDVGMFDERAVAYWEEHELARKYRERGQIAYYLAHAFVYHRWRKGGGEHESENLMQRYFDDSMRLYYAESYGTVGRVVFDVLSTGQRAGRAVARAVGR